MMNFDDNRRHSVQGAAHRRHIYSSDDIGNLTPMHGALFVFQNLVIAVRGDRIVAIACVIRGKKRNVSRVK